MARMTEAQVEAIEQANAYLNNAGLQTINQMLGIQAKQVQQAMTLELQVIVRSNYGAPQIYPANDAGRLFAQIAGTKTLTLFTLAKAKELGYRIVQVEDPTQQLIFVPGLQALTVGA